jgi:Xaa-Pro dipeptidase
MSIQVHSHQQYYSEHIAELRCRYDDALERSGRAAVVIGAGQPHGIFQDDQHLPYKANPYLLQWGPLLEHPGSALLIRPGETPQLLVHVPTDYWHSVPEIPELWTHSGLEIIRLKSRDDIATLLAKTLDNTSADVAFIGETLSADDSFGIESVNPPKLIEILNEFRTVKTPWEIANMKAASLIGVQGHLAAEQCFRGGGSEYEIQLAFRAACNVTDTEMPYPAIVALNEHGATLHYQRLDRQRGPNRSLLIDAGHAVNGYASDITRSHSDDAEFGALIEAMHELQRNLCAAALPGMDYRELHHAAHQAVTALLVEIGVIDGTVEAALEARLSTSFFPHGLGHFLGLQVHDVGALYTRRKPDETTQPDEDQHLRLTRVLAPGNVLTIEPGVYFIDSLLAELKAKPAASMVNWNRIDQLHPFGGIRIEDNLHITADGNENLTRTAFGTLS